jgi:hypothetical protein
MGKQLGCAQIPRPRKPHSAFRQHECNCKYYQFCQGTSLSLINNIKQVVGTWTRTSNILFDQNQSNSSWVMRWHSIKVPIILKTENLIKICSAVCGCSGVPEWWNNGNCASVQNKIVWRMPHVQQCITMLNFLKGFLLIAVCLEIDLKFITAMSWSETLSTVQSSVCHLGVTLSNLSLRKGWRTCCIIGNWRKLVIIFKFLDWRRRMSKLNNKLGNVCTA